MSEEKKYTNRIFVIKVTGGQERAVANLIYSKILARKLDLYSVIYVDKMKGYLMVEGKNIQPLVDLISGIKHVRNIVPGAMTIKDIENLISPREVGIELRPDQEVMVISGPFKGMKARVVRHDKERREATILLLDTPYQLQVTVEDSYLKPLEGQS